MLGDAFSWIFNILTTWYVWMPVAAVLVYLTYRNNRRAKNVTETEHALLVLEIPRTNDKTELAAEQMFASLHGILRDKRELALSGGLQEHISFEVASIGKHIRFYVWVPKHLQNFVEGQVYAQYPTVQIHEAEEDYTRRDMTGHEVVHSAELKFTDLEMLPIKTFQNFEVDPLAGITATLAKLEDNNEEMWIQVIVRPIADDWHRRAQRYVESIRNGGFGAGGDFLGNAGFYLVRALAALWKPPEGSTGSTARELSEREKTRIAEIEKKSTKLGYQVKIRLLYMGDDQNVAKLRMQAIVGAFKQFNSTNLNGFSITKNSFDREMLLYYAARLFIDKGYILNIEELASVFHLPHTNVETPSIVWASSKTAEPPAKLPILIGDDDADAELSAFGLTDFRGLNQQFGLYRSDRGRHVYIIGQTGTGKSGMLELFALSDVFHNEGYAIIDPHGDFAVNNLRFIPPHRIKDVVYFNPADTAFPIGFNPMEVYDPSQRNNISSEIIGVLKRMFAESWGPRLEYILRYTILALLYYPGSTLLDITRMLTDKRFREEVLTYVDDTVVLNFWKIEFASWNDRFMTEAVAPVLNKVGAFTANPIIRNIVGQKYSTFNIRHIMDEGKILIVNLSRGLIGEDNAGILGSFLVTKIQLAAMSRADIPNVDDRRPFYLYVDEFQNFATDSFATILSEARKYGLNLTVANQYISQMSEPVRDAVFGNVGTTITFRVSADDAPLLVKQFEPTFEAMDLLQMHNRHFIISMVIKGEKVPAFSATTLQLPEAQADNMPAIVDNTRRNFASNRDDVDADIKERIIPPAHLKKPQQQQQQLPQSQNMAKKWPVDAGARPAAKIPAQNAPDPKKDEPKPLPLAEDKPKPLPMAEEKQIPAHTEQSGGEGTGEGKRKRRRSRSRNKNKGQSPDQQQTHEPAKPQEQGSGKQQHQDQHSSPTEQGGKTPHHKQTEHSIQSIEKSSDGVELRLR